jgi:hypothetical protein
MHGFLDQILVQWKAAIQCLTSLTAFLDQQLVGCAGLPEEMAIVKKALARSYVPVAFSSADKDNRCWDGQWLDQSVDIPEVPPPPSHYNASESDDILIYQPTMLQTGLMSGSISHCYGQIREVLRQGCAVYTSWLWSCRSRRPIRRCRSGRAGASCPPTRLEHPQELPW